MVGLEMRGSARGLAKTVSSREALSKFHCDVGRLTLRQKVGPLRGLSLEWCRRKMSVQWSSLRLVRLEKEEGSWLKSPSMSTGWL